MKFVKKILNFCLITSHKSQAIGKAIGRCLVDWGIQEIFSIIVHNASSNDVAIGHLTKKFNVAETSILGGKFFI